MKINLQLQYYQTKYSIHDTIGDFVWQRNMEEVGGAIWDFVEQNLEDATELNLGIKVSNNIRHLIKEMNE